MSSVFPPIYGFLRYSLSALGLTAPYNYLLKCPLLGNSGHYAIWQEWAFSLVIKKGKFQIYPSNFRYLQIYPAIFHNYKFAHPEY
jgi:hypothetical protein